MAEDNKGTAKAREPGEQQRTLMRAPETGTPTTPGAGPAPDAVHPALTEPSLGPAAGATTPAMAQAGSAAAVQHATPEPAPARGRSSSGHVVEAEDAFTDEAVAHRQEVEQGERGAQRDRTP